MTWLALTLLACGAPAPEAPAEAAPAPAAAPSPEAAPAGTSAAGVEIPSSDGLIRVIPVMHATTVIEVGGKVVWLDPWSKGELTAHPKADIVLITDLHPDHLDQDALAAVRKEGTVLVAPQAVADALGQPVDHVLANGATVELGALKVTAVPMYNLVRGPEGGGLYHDKGRGNGYILESGGKRLYFAGDTECTDEMKALTAIDAAFLPMNLPYTMTPEEAAGCVKAFAPKLAIPYHYRDADRGAFARALEGTGVEVRLVDWYPGQG